MMEQQFGDGAAAFLVGKENVIAEILGVYTYLMNCRDVRSDDDKFVRSAKTVLSWTRVCEVPAMAIQGVLKKCGLTAKDISKVAFDAPGTRGDMPRRDSRRGSKRPSARPFALFLNVGIAGCAMAPMMLICALEEAKPGDKILVAGSGNGADAFVLQVTDAIKKLGARRGIKNNIASKVVMANYNDYLKWRELVPQEAAEGRTDSTSECQ